MVSLSDIERGKYLADSDFNSVDLFISFLKKQVLEYMAAQIRDLEQNVASARRGISNRIFKVGLKYFGGKLAPIPVSTFIDPSGVVMFHHTSPEMMLRRLADFAFMVRDYKYAQGIYELVKKDFSSNEKYIKYLAGIQEMLALCILMQDSRSAVDVLIDSAIQLYQDAKAPHFATRTCIFLTEVLKEHGAFRETALFLIRMSIEVFVT